MYPPVAKTLGSPCYVPPRARAPLTRLSNPGMNPDVTTSRQDCNAGQQCAKSKISEPDPTRPARSRGQPAQPGPCQFFSEANPSRPDPWTFFENPTRPARPENLSLRNANAHPSVIPHSVKPQRHPLLILHIQQYSKQAFSAHITTHHITSQVLILISAVVWAKLFD